MLETNRLLLDVVEPVIAGEVADSELDGRVAVAAGALLERCRIQGPVAIGEGAVLRDAYIGPYTAVAEGCVIERAEIENSIILEHAKISDLHHRLEGSLIGRNVVIGGQNSKPNAYRILVGDDSHIGIL
jgi:glucose-1-phosphate thymidylyltransferase